jgi:hypothetical protein
MEGMHLNTHLAYQPSNRLFLCTGKAELCTPQATQHRLRYREATRAPGRSMGKEK